MNMLRLLRSCSCPFVTKLLISLVCVTSVQCVGPPSSWTPRCRHHDYHQGGILSGVLQTGVNSIKFLRYRSLFFLFEVDRCCCHVIVYFHKEHYHRVYSAVLPTTRDTSKETTSVGLGKFVKCRRIFPAILSLT